MTEPDLKRFDAMLDDDAEYAAIVVKEYLRPVDGPHGVFFPPTFAPTGRGQKSDYLIDNLAGDTSDPQQATKDGRIVNRCTVDSVPSQANRLEARLKPFVGSAIPKVTLTGSRVGQSLDLLDVGHRVGDAAIRYTSVKKGGEKKDAFEPFKKALESYVAGDAGPLAQLAPTSLAFGHWDSRGETKSKARRLIRSEIVAYNVAKVSRRSQYWSSIDPDVDEELLKEAEEAKEAVREGSEPKNAASQLGMTDVPAPRSPGGVIAFGSIERTSIVALSGLRCLAANEDPFKEGTTDPDASVRLRRYLLALCLAAIAPDGAWDLREGCILVRDADRPASLVITRVKHDGTAEPFVLLTRHEAKAFLEQASSAFFGGDVPEPVELTFDPEMARAAMAEKRKKGDGGKKSKGSGKKQKGTPDEPSPAPEGSSGS